MTCVSSDRAWKYLGHGRRSSLNDMGQLTQGMEILGNHLGADQQEKQCSLNLDGSPVRRKFSGAFLPMQCPQCGQWRADPLCEHVDFNNASVPQPQLVCHAVNLQGPLLLTWIHFNSSSVRTSGSWNLLIRMEGLPQGPYIWVHFWWNVLRIGSYILSSSLQLGFKQHISSNCGNHRYLVAVVGWVGLWGFLWWTHSTKRKDHHGVSSGWSSVWHRSNTGLSSPQYE